MTFGSTPFVAGAVESKTRTKPDAGGIGRITRRNLHRS